MKNYTHILFDIDDTIFDFPSAEKAALESVFKYLHLDLTPAIHQTYTAFNRKLWDQIDKGQLTRDQMQAMRFSTFFKKEFNLDIKDNNKLLQIYQNGMATSHIFNLHAKDTIKKLHQQGFHLAIISNGIYRVQKKRLTEGGVIDDFDHLFVSEKMGVMKPTKKFFAYIFQKTDYSPNNSIVIGDDLKADISGAKASHLDSIWYNRHHEMNISNIHPSFVIDDLAAIPSLLA